MTCAILVPSLNRAHRLEAVAANIHAATPEPHRILFCVGDPDSRAVLDRLGEWYLDDEDYPDKRYVTRMNKLVREVGDADTIFFGSDDVVHHPGWLSAALAVLNDGAEVVIVNDLHNPNGTQALIRTRYLARAVFDSPGDAFHGGYHHNFADTEQFYTASVNKVLGRAMSSVVEHLHPVFGHEGSLPWDDTYRDAGIGWSHDESLFMQRLARLNEERGIA